MLKKTQMQAMATFFMSHLHDNIVHQEDCGGMIKEVLNTDSLSHKKTPQTDLGCFGAFLEFIF